ncbi:hypothetical protein H4Q26_001080 [Puccinia striiformis f. sp. tritici PST-130]|nr:hypothetical protein H4Q26_001080 [Puccinia striiformis f. sp. tritici PST-130]
MKDCLLDDRTNACRTANATVDPRQLMGFSSRSSPNMPRIVETSQHSILASDIDATFGMTCLVAGFFSWPHCVYLPRRKSLEWREAGGGRYIVQTSSSGEKSSS